MVNKVQGFSVEVTVKDAIPHVRVCFADGKPVLETSALSIAGMENMSVVLAHAAKMTYDELDRYWQLQHEKLRK
jgi:hypothetical protein